MRRRLPAYQRGVNRSKKQRGRPTGTDQNVTKRQNSGGTDQAYTNRG